MRHRPAILVVLATLFGGGCAQSPAIPTAGDVDLERFMGDWYVIAHIPTRVERRAYNAIESYSLADDGTVQTVFQFRNDRFDAPLETMRPVGYVRPGTGNAVWGMQFFWPIKAEYVIAHVDPQYRETIIARSARDYAWIMARSPTIPDADLERLEAKLVELDYGRDALRRVPQQWPETTDDRRPSP
jgi:apolipoprotein D and lipocalin family protein